MVNTYRVLIVVFILLSTSALLAHLNKSEVRIANQSLSNFPLQIDTWRGELLHFEDWVYDKTGVDDSFLGRFYNTSGNYIEL